AGAAVAGQLADQLLHHLATDAQPADGRGDGEVQDVQLVLVQLVDHEADHLLLVLGDHADTVALAQAAEEVLLGPRVVKAPLFGLEHFRHVPADHPPDVDAQQILLRATRAHVATSPLARRAPPLRGTGAAAVLIPFRTGDRSIVWCGRRGGLVQPLPKPRAY